jgi:hypothetical protein
MTAHRGRRVSRAEFARMWMDQTITAAQIAETLDISVQAVRQRAITRGLPPRKGGGGCRRKIDPLMCRLMWSANVGLADMAAFFDVHPIGLARRARIWGFPPRDCNRWNATPIAAFLMARSAAETRGAMKMAEMVDGTARMFA